MKFGKLNLIKWKLKRIIVQIEIFLPPIHYYSKNKERERERNHKNNSAERTSQRALRGVERGNLHHLPCHFRRSGTSGSGGLQCTQSYEVPFPSSQWSSSNVIMAGWLEPRLFFMCQKQKASNFFTVRIAKHLKAMRKGIIISRHTF